MPVMAEMVPGRETVREETEAGQAESPESGQTGPQGQETVQPGAAPEESTGGPQIAAPSALLMEASTGTVIFEKNADEPRNPASVTKIMTLILIFDGPPVRKDPSGRPGGDQRLRQIHGRLPGIPGGGGDADRGNTDQVHRSSPPATMPPWPWRST